ncbi:hypothetical protein OZ401_004794 (plasmid) [Candidatus Chlorohelix allophototropha]|uniref:RING-type domain-containing protein n=1 Tax=Candidatus Chlorohelix allophototropha TaxID=3003348 RepID=A0ABY9B9W3_9CHLR|nr:hypothetical protein OZ401_004794 [Chloroflexota bacterium L227-S17]
MIPPIFCPAHCADVPISPCRHTFSHTLCGNTPQPVACSFCTVTDGARTFPPFPFLQSSDLRWWARL